MNLLEQLDFYAQNHGQDIAVRSGDSFFTYEQLDHYSGRLANAIQKRCGDDKAPVIVYGHKGIAMILCFLAAVKSGRAYCPQDISIPDARVEAVAETVQPSLIFALEDSRADLKDAVTLSETMEMIRREPEPVDKSFQVKGEEVFYIIFTSGSTGSPKGVQVTADN